MRLLNESKIDPATNSKYYLGKVETVDENYIVTFSIPGILENLSKYPKAYPKQTNHVKEVKEGDSILIQQLDSLNQFFVYEQFNKNGDTGIYFGDVKVDITDGKTVLIETKTTKITVDGENNKIFIGNDNYSLNQFIADLDTALSSLHTEGSQSSHTATTWYSTSVQLATTKAKQLFPT